MRQCIDQYGRLVWSIAKRLTRTNADAEDATQDVFLQIWRHASRFDDTLGSEAGFIATITRRRIIDKWRKRQSEPVLELFAPEMMEILSWVPVEENEHAESALDADIAVRAMAALRPDHRVVLELGFVYGFTHSEIAQRLLLPLGTVKSHMRRGLMEVRIALGTNESLNTAA